MPLTSADLDQLAKAAAEELGVVGAQVAVLSDAGIEEGVHGVANAMTNVAVSRDTLFQVGSTTKMYTAALVMQLVEDGTVGLDTPVVEQLPGFKLADQAATHAVTPRHLMSMSSGIDNGPYTLLGFEADALSRYVAALSELPMSFEPGTGFGYSNASTNVSGRLIEHVTGQTWDDALRIRLLDAAGLTQSSSLSEELLTRRVALGHAPLSSPGDDPKVTLPFVATRAIGPAGSTLCCTAGDLVRFASIFIEDGVGANGNRVLSTDAVKQMQDRQVTLPPTLLSDWWGLGPSGVLWGSERLLGHSGTNISGSSYLLWAPERRVAVATVVNTPGLGYPFAKRIFDATFGSIDITPPPAPVPPASVTFDAARLCGRYEMSGVALVIDGDSSALFATIIEGLAVSGRSPLVPLTATTFLPTDPAIDGRRGWALAFIGDDERPATHLINGYFALRRVAA